MHTMSQGEEPTLLDDWRHFLRDINSPDSFIDMGFYYMIGAALQRRVWVNPAKAPIFPNVYYVLAGPPGCGKGMVTRPVRTFMSYFKYDPREVLTDPLVTNPQHAPDVLRLLEELKELQSNITVKKGLQEEKLLFPIPADCLTFQALTRANAEAIRRKDTSVKCALVPGSGIYTHSSMCFILEELGHLLREREIETLRYLLQAWDCETFKYDTKHQGKDIIRNTCLSILAGTTLGSMQDSMSNQIVKEGLSARIIFVVEDKNRQNVFRMREFSESQLESEAKILKHLKELSTLFGQVTYTPEAEEVFRTYICDELPKKRVNPAPELDYYYSRKRTHIEKLAMAIHFSTTSTGMVIQPETCHKTLATLAKLEVNMHKALVYTAKNPLAEPSRKVVKLLKNGGPKNYKQIWILLDGDVRASELEEVIRFLTETGQIKLNEKEQYEAI